MSLKMFVCFKYIVLIVSFNHCCGASHLIPTTVLSPSGRRPTINSHLNIGSLNTAAANAYSMYAMPHISNPNIQLKYSASRLQPIVELPRTYKITNTMGTNTDHKQSNSKKPFEMYLPVRQSAPVEYGSVPISTPNYVTSRLNERTPRILSTQSNPSTIQKPTNSVSLKSQTIGQVSTVSPLYLEHRLERISKPLTTTKRPKLNTFTNTTGFMKIDSNLFNKWTQTTPQPQQQQPQQQSQQAYPQKEIQQASNPNPKVLDSQQQHSQQNNSVEPQNPKNNIQQNIVQQSHELQHEDVRPVSSAQGTQFELEESVPQLRQEIQKETNDSEKIEKSFPFDSEQSYRMEFYDTSKNQNYEQTGDQMNSWDPSSDENNGFANPENYQYFENPVPEPEPEFSEPQHENNDKHAIDISDDSTGSDLKSLLEQFIQQLELLKSVASKELVKANDNSFSHNSKQNNDIISQTVVEPSISRTGATYDDYQNDRSFEQNSANLDTKTYKDTNERKRYPCKKNPFHIGGLPYTGVPI